MFKKLFGQMQRIGKALMLPVAILPAAGVAISNWDCVSRRSVTTLSSIYKK